jgi:hypothetical protein
MATQVTTAQSVFQNGNAKVSKFCMTYTQVAEFMEEQRRNNEQDREDTLAAILEISLEEKTLREIEKETQQWNTGWGGPSKKSWMEKIKEDAATAHEKAVLWYEDWKEGKTEDIVETFEERITKVKARISADRIIAADPGYEC